MMIPGTTMPAVMKINACYKIKVIIILIHWSHFYLQTLLIPTPTVLIVLVQFRVSVPSIQERAGRLYFNDYFKGFHSEGSTVELIILHE